MFYFLPPWRVSWAWERNCCQERQAWDPTCYTQTSLETCTEKWLRATFFDTTDPYYFWNEMKAEILKWNTHKNCQKLRNTTIHDFYYWNKCTKTIKIQSARLARMVATLSLRRDVTTMLIPKKMITMRLWRYFYDKNAFEASL